MEIAIITGASKGLGAAISRAFIDKKIGIVSIARTENESLNLYAVQQNVPYYHFSCDLSNISEMENTFTKIFNQFESLHIDQYYVVNNAGVVNPIEIVGKLDSTEVERHYSINAIAPILIANKFLHSQNKVPTFIVNITSGAGTRPMHGWSIYCSSKASINMFTKTAALELNNHASKHKIIAFSPGIMDTEMQGDIRDSSKEAFNELDTFIQYKEKGMLRDPHVVGTVLVDKILLGNSLNGEIYHVSDLLEEN